MNSGTVIRCQSAPWNRAIEFLVRRDGMNVAALCYSERDLSAKAEPTFSLEMEAAQTLMDDLWNAGIRPTEGAGSAGAMRATERHLEDMRTLVFKVIPK